MTKFTPGESSISAAPITEANHESVEVSGQNALRLRVAELCGWHDWRGFDSPDERVAAFGDVFPNYPSDLNACADFERDVLKKNVRLYLAYARLLTEWQGAFDAIFASAKTRCEAFVEVMKAPSVVRSSQALTPPGKQEAAAAQVELADRVYEASEYYPDFERYPEPE